MADETETQDETPDVAQVRITVEGPEGRASNQVTVTMAELRTYVTGGRTLLYNRAERALAEALDAWAEQHLPAPPHDDGE